MDDNCYLLLELDFDPPVEDQAVINQRIEEKARFWSSNYNDFKRGAEYRHYHQMLPKIQEIMSNPVKREKEAVSACSIVYALLDEDLKILGIGGEIPEDVVVNIADKKKISVNAVKKRASALGIKIVPKIDFQITYNNYYKNKPKNADEFESVVVYLKPFNKDNLYDFLNPGTVQIMDKLPCDKLKQLAQEKKKNDFYKNDPYSSSGKKVCEACELAFRNESSKTVYDEYLAWRKRKSILDHAKEISKVADGNLSYEQGDVYIGQLTELFKDRKLAENIFIAFCKIEKIAYNPDLYNPDSQKRRRSDKEAEKEAKEEAEKKAREEEKLRKQKEEAEKKVREGQEKLRKQKEETEKKVREGQEKLRKQKEEAEKKAREEENLRKHKEKAEIAKRNRQKKLAIGIVLCLLIFCGVALINATYLKDSQSTPSGVSQASADPIASYSNNTNSIDTKNAIEEPVLPVADFWSDTTSGEAPLKVQFYDESTGSPTSWNWNFGDKVSSTKRSPMHIYTTAGVYTVKETVTNGAGENTKLKTKYITVTPPEDTGTSVDTGTVSDNKGTGSDTSTVSDNKGTGSDTGTTSDKGTGSDTGHSDTGSGTSSDTSPDPGTPIASYPTKSEVLTFVNDYKGVNDFIETVSIASQSDHPEWKWDIWQDQNENKISFYHYQNNPKGYDSIYFDSKGKITSKHTTLLIRHYP